MLPYQERVVQEKKDLDERLMRIGEFFNNGQHMRLGIDERSLLLEQWSVMAEYSAILYKRIALFVPNALEVTEH